MTNKNTPPADDRARMTEHHRLTISSALNTLKAKTLNLIEASGLSPEQCEAMKSLYRGFSSEAYRAIGVGIVGLEAHSGGINLEMFTPEEYWLLSSSSPAAPVPSA